MTRLANTTPSPSRATKAELAAQVATLTTRIQELEQANADLQSENAALIDNQGHFASLVEHMPAVAFVRDFEGRFKHVNPRYEETYGVLNEAVCGKKLHDVLPKEMAENYADQDRRVITENQVVEQEITVDIEGNARDILSIRFPIRDAEEETVAVGGIEQDITARKQAEAALRENEARFRTIIDQLPVSFSLKDSDDRYLVINQKFQDWFADSEISVPGKSTDDLYDDEFATKLVETDRHVCETGETVTQEFVQPFADGLMHTTQMTKFPIRLQDDKSILVGTVDVDVTQIKQMEHQLRDSEERFRTLVENTRGIVYRYLLDDDYTMEYIGGAVEQITGYPPSDFLAGETGAVRTYASIVHPEDANAIRTEIAEAINVGREFDIEYRILHRDGSSRWVHSVGAAVTGTDGRLKWIDGTLIDIAERKKADEELRQQRKNLHHVLENVPQGIVKWDADQRLSIWNRHYQEVLSVPDHLIKTGSSLKDLTQFLAERGDYGDGDPQELSDARIEVLYSGAVHRNELTIGDEKTYDVLVQRTDDGGIVITYTDITERKAQEDALRRNEEQVRRILEDSPIALAISLDDQSEDDGALQFANTRFINLMGFSRADIGAARTESFLAKDSANREKHEAALDAGESLHNMEQLVVGKEGRDIWTLMSISPIEYRERKAALIWLYDITEQKNAELEIRRSHERLNSILESSPMGIAVTRRDNGRTLYTNARLAEQLQLGDDRNLGRDLSAYWADPKDRETIFGRARREDFVENVEVRRRRSDGSTFWALMSALPLNYEGKDALLSWTYDITERKDAEEGQRKSERTANALREAIEVFSDSVILYDKDERVVFTNHKYHELYPNSPCKAEIAGYSQEELLRFSVQNGLIDDPLAKTNPDAWISKRLDVRRQNRDSSGETNHSNGHTYLLRHKPTTDGGLIVAHTDITERKEAEAALRIAKEQAELALAAQLESEKAANALREAIEVFSDSVVLYDKDERVVFTNDKYHELYPHSPCKAEIAGYSQEELLRLTVQKRWIDDPVANTDPETWIADRLEERRRNRETTGEIDHTNNRTYLFRHKPTADGGMLVVHMDITERKRAEVALRESEERVRTLVENMRGIAYRCLLDEAWTMTYIGGAVEEITGYPPSDFQDNTLRTFAEVLHPDDSDRVTYEIEEAVAARRDFRLEYRIRHRDGSQRWVLSVGKPILDAHGELKWLDGTLFDITERKQAEDRFRALLDSAPDATVIVNVNGEIVEANLQTENLFGYATDKIVGRKVETLLPDRFRQGHPIHRETFLRSAKARPMGIGLELFAQAKDGREFPIEISLSPIETHEGTLVSASVRDITQRKQAENDLRIAKEQAEAAFAGLKQTQARLVQTEKMASLGELTAGIAHEIKNPLNFVNNFSETSVELLDELKEVLEPVHETLDQDAREDVDDIFVTLKGDLQKINHHGRRADNIVKSMLLHARGEASERVLTLVNDLVEEAFNLAYHGERARDTSFQVTMEHNFDEATGEAVIVPQDITRVLVNLLSNAFYAVKKRSRNAGPGAYTPTVVVRTLDKGEEIEIRVRDNGIGIPEEVREKLFDPFFTTKPTGEGTGLGLSMSFDIIAQQHGGRIDVDSKPGAFTEFVITLPRQQDKDKGGKT